MVDQGTFGDTAGAIPSNGIVVRGLRTLIVARTRELTFKSALQAVAESVALDTASDDQWVVVVERAGTGERVAERPFGSRAKATRARARFIRRVEAMSDADAATADWGAVLTRS